MELWWLLNQGNAIVQWADWDWAYYSCNKLALQDNFYETKKWAPAAMHCIIVIFLVNLQSSTIHLTIYMIIFYFFLFSSKYLNFEWFGQTCRTSEFSELELRVFFCQITKCGCKINNLTIFSVFLFSSKYLNFEWFGQTCRTSECSKLDLRDECCPFRRRSKVAENGLVQGRKSKYP